MPKKSVSKEKPAERRRYIWQTVARDGILSHEMLKQRFENLTSQNIADDIKALRELGHNLRSVPDTIDKRKSNIIDEDARHTRSKKPREQLNHNEKRAVATVLMGVICGFPSSVSPEAAGVDNRDSDGSKETEHRETIERQSRLAEAVPKIFKDCPSIHDLREQIEDHKEFTSSNYRKVRRRIDSYWNEMNRGIAIDAGTTNDQTALLLQQLSLPAAFSNLSALTVCTNSRGIFQTLGSAETDAKVIMIGGEQVNRTEAVAGRMAELFLRSAGILSFGLGVSGTTMVNLKEMSFNSDSHEEANLKALIFQRSALRIVVFDHTKLTKEPIRSSYPFATIDPEQVDLVITNEPEGGATEEFTEAIRAIRENGITVLLG